MKRRFLLGAFYLASWMPRVFAQWMGRLLGRVLWLANTEARRVTEINLRLCYPGCSEAERELLARQSLIATAMTCLLYTSPSPRDAHESRMPSSA